MTILALDTEDDSEGNVTWINFYDGRKHRSFRGSDRRQAWQYLADRAKCTVFACNMEYDLVNLYGDWVDKLTTLQYTDSGFLRAHATYAPVAFYDTLRHWPGVGVRRMGEFIGVPKTAFNPESIEYCQRDTEIVWRFVAAMLERYQGLGLKLRSTLPSMAFQLWRQMYQEPTGLPLFLNAEMRDGYYGGRVECYYLGAFDSAVHHYDFTSLYPTVMTRPFPLPSAWRVTRTPTLDRDGMLWGILRIPPQSVPPLPVREDGELIFPTGRLYGAWTYEEVRNALLAGAVLEQARKAVEFAGECQPFYDYVHRCMREKDRSEGIDREFWKLMMNALYGKFGQESTLTIIKNGREYTLTPRQPKHVNVLWAATITARARVMLWRGMLEAHPLYYVDTDSLFTERALTTGAGLGMIREVGSYRGGHFFGNKCYVVEGQATAKGIPKPRSEEDANFPLQFLLAGRTIFRKPARLREARRQGLIPNKWYQDERVRDPEYRKRQGGPGFTRPWDLHEYREQWIS